MKRITLDAQALQFVAQRTDDAATVGDIVRVPGRGDRIASITDTHPKSNTVTAEILPGTARDLASLIERWFNFTGMEPRTLEVVPAPKQYSSFYKLGTLLAVEYEAVKDGRKLSFRHAFKKSARPALAVSPDGLQIGILGGEFRVTDHGIVDD